MSLFQRIYNWFFRIKTPEWVKELGFEIQTLIGDALKQIGKEAYNMIVKKIIEEAATSKPSAEKFKAVYEFAKIVCGGLKDSVLNAVINSIVLLLKNKGTIA